MGLPMSVVAIASSEARELYQSDLALIRPDQMVAWRGSNGSQAAAVLRQSAGHF